MSQIEVSIMKQEQQPVPLGTLIGRELRNEKLEKPTLIYGQAALAKKGEDYFLIKLDYQRVPGNPSTSFSVFAVCWLSFWSWCLIWNADGDVFTAWFYGRFLMGIMAYQLLYLLRRICWKMFWVLFLNHLVEESGFKPFRGHW